MKSPRTIRTLAVIATAGLVMGAFAAAPAEAKKKKKKKKPAACSTFTPGEAGTDKPTLTITDAATEAAPIEQTVTLAESVADFGVGDPGQDAFNVQVDSAAPEAGLHVLVEFPSRRDIDLNLLHTDGSYAARSRSWNTIQEITDQGPVTVSTQGHGGEGTDHSEHLVGIRTSDCGGWTVEAQNWLGEGGEFTVKVWVGEIVNDPQAPGAETP